MGSGGISGNQSVHWRINHDDSPHAAPTVAGVDDLQGKGFAALGLGSHGNKSHAGNFEVTLRFDDEASGKAALQRALSSIKSHTGYATATLHVRAINRKKDEPIGQPEIKIDW